MSLKALRKELKNKRVDKFDIGTVIRWTASERFTYAAVKTPVGWFTTSTGNVYVEQVLTFEDLVETLQKAEASNIEVATDWEAV